MSYKGVKLTKAQRIMLETARDFGTSFALVFIRMRAGGSSRRMIGRLVKRGLLTRSPYKITEAGRLALENRND